MASLVSTNSRVSRVLEARLCRLCLKPDSVLPTAQIEKGMGQANWKDFGGINMGSTSISGQLHPFWEDERGKKRINHPPKRMVGNTGPTLAKCGGVAIVALGRLGNDWD